MTGFRCHSHKDSGTRLPYLPASASVIQHDVCKSLDAVRMKDFDALA